MTYFRFKNKNIYYREKGKGDILLVLPGNTASSVVYQEQIDYFAKHYHVISLDYLCTGQSDRLPNWNINWWKKNAEQLNELLKHLNNKNKVIIIGSSGGAIVGIHFAKMFPNKVKSLILDSFSSHFNEKMLIDNVINERNNPNDFQKQFWQFCHGNDWEEIIFQDTKILKELISVSGNWTGGSLDKIKCPVLLIGSKEDSFIPNIEQEYNKISNEIDNCKIALTDNGDHPLIWSNQDFFYKEVMNFLAP